MKKIINIGIVAHVDAGKTTITENLLYYSGAIKSVGRVDLGNTQTDSMELERKRGITIKSSTISFNWNNVKVNIIDTPGHVDFISEVERSLNSLDGAILVISGVEGIQSQTRILFDTLKELNIPTIIFVNKLDRIGANFNKVFEEIKKNMSNKVVRLQEVYDVGSKAVYIKKLFDTCIINDDAINVLSDLDEAFLERYIGGIEPDKEEIQEKLSLYAREGSLYPSNDCESDLSGVVFKIERTSKNEKKVYVRLFGGKISVRDKIQVPNKEIAEKVKKINRLENGGVVEAQRIEAGDIGILYGLTSFQVGDVIGISNDKIKNISIAKPALKTTISAIDKEKNPELFKALTLLAEEDPLLELEMNDIDKEIYVNLFGEVQMEILSSMLDDLYGIKVEFSNIETIYKETPKGFGASIMHMQEDLNPFWATVGLEIEPAGRGEGLRYISNVSVGSLPKSFQNAIEEAVIKTSKQGLFGWEVTDVKVTLSCGEFFSPASTPADFRNVTPMVFMEALYKAQTVLLEPLHEFELKIPQNALSKAVWDLETMRATFDNPIVIGDEFSIKGLIPVENSKEYKMKIASYTEGRGMFVTKFYGYKEASAEFSKARKKTTYDPLNKKEYLLHKLNAIRD